MEGMNKVKGYRVMAGFTQSDMAKALNISVVNYNQKETGERAFKADEMVLFVTKIREKNPNVTMDEIFM